MRIAVVTPYYREEDATLRQCMESVRAQAFPVTHFLVADGYPKDWVAQSVSNHIALPGTGHRDFGGLARCVGCLTAAADGFDAIALLDADNWYRADHIASLVALQSATNAAVCTSSRSLHRLDGSVLWAQDSLSDGKGFADTSTFFYMREAFGLLPMWGLMPRRLGAVSDRVMWSAIAARNLKHAHTGLPTVAFRTSYSAHYEQLGEAPPADAKDPGPIREQIEYWNALPELEKRRILLGF